MKQVTFWSVNHGVGTTTKAIITSINICLEYSLKILLTHNQYIKSNLEAAFLTGKESESIINFEDAGIDALERLAKSCLLKPETIKDYTRTLIGDRLDLLTGTNKPRKEMFKNIEGTLMYILGCAKKAYDLIFVDANSGVENAITHKILEASDIVVVCLNQTDKVLKTFFIEHEGYKYLEKKKVIVVIGCYDANSKYTVRYIKNNYIKDNFNYKEKIFTVPYNTNFMDAHNDHRVLDYFYSNKNIFKDDDNYHFTNEIKKLSDKILELAEIDTKYIHNSIYKDNILKRMLNLK